MAGVPGTTTGATVVAETAVVVVAGAVVVGAIEAAAEQPPARATPPIPQYQGSPEPSGQVPPKYTVSGRNFYYDSDIRVGPCRAKDNYGLVFQSDKNSFFAATDGVFGASRPVMRALFNELNL